MSFGPWIRVQREKAGLGLNEMARKLGISPAYWSRIERGREKAPKDELIMAACKMLSLDTDSAFLEAKRMPPDMQRDLGRVVVAYRRLRAGGQR